MCYRGYLEAQNELEKNLWLFLIIADLVCPASSMVGKNTFWIN
jgi:hypothetical protein